jgi:hypothetical protein
LAIGADADGTHVGGFADVEGDDSEAGHWPDVEEDESEAGGWSDIESVVTALDSGESGADGCAIKVGGCADVEEGDESGAGGWADVESAVTVGGGADIEGNISEAGGGKLAFNISLSICASMVDIVELEGVHWHFLGRDSHVLVVIAI